MTSLNQLIKTETPTIICDIGASSIDPTVHIDNLINNTNCILYGFEPNKTEFEKLKETEKKKYFNYALGDGKKKKLNICQGPGMTSFLRPNINYLRLFDWFEWGSKIIKTEELETKKLDDINFDHPINFFKIDVQGLESEIIENGLEKIKNSVVVEIETSPVPIYLDEKPFSHICGQLEKLDFSLHMFYKINTRCFKPTRLNNDIYSGLNHILQLDCVFIKNVQKLDSLETEDLKKLALILFYSYESYDLVDFLIEKISKKQKDDLIIKYRNMMSALTIRKKY